MKYQKIRNKFCFYFIGKLHKNSDLLYFSRVILENSLTNGEDKFINRHVGVLNPFQIKKESTFKNLGRIYEIRKWMSSPQENLQF